jgi:hypothetical protein
MIATVWSGLSSYFWGWQANRIKMGERKPPILRPSANYNAQFLIFFPFHFHCNLSLNNKDHNATSHAAQPPIQEVIQHWLHGRLLEETTYQFIVAHLVVLIRNIFNYNFLSNESVGPGPGITSLTFSEFVGLPIYAYMNTHQHVPQTLAT